MVLTAIIAIELFSTFLLIVGLASGLVQAIERWWLK